MRPMNPKTAADIMTTRLLVLSPGAPVKDATHVLLRRGFSGAPVATADGKVLGVFTERDSLRAMTEAVFDAWPSGTVSDHMTQKLSRVDPDADLMRVSTQLTSGAGRRVLVMDGDKLAGLITRSDLMRALDHMLQPDRPPTTYELISEHRGT